MPSDREVLAGFVERVTFHNEEIGFLRSADQGTRSSRTDHGRRSPRAGLLLIFFPRLGLGLCSNCAFRLLFADRRFCLRRYTVRFRTRMVWRSSRKSGSLSEEQAKRLHLDPMVAANDAPLGTALYRLGRLPPWANHRHFGRRAGEASEEAGDDRIASGWLLRGARLRPDPTLPP
jgi:hypothetical protein